MSSAESKLLARIRQMQFAMGQSETKDMSKLEVRILQLDGINSFSVNPNDGVSADELAVFVSIILAEIASLKDYLKLWCREKGVSFDGEGLINTDLNVAIVHDLWNLDKHAKLNRKSRSGLEPTYRNLQRVMKFKIGTEEDSTTFFRMDPATGEITAGGTGGGDVSLALSAIIEDENGNIIGEFMEVCESAVNSWTSELVRSGVPIA